MIRPYEGLPHVASLDEIKVWLGPLILENTNIWIRVGSQIDKTVLNVPAIFWIIFITNTIMRSLNKSVFSTSQRSMPGYHHEQAEH